MNGRSISTLRSAVVPCVIAAAVFCASPTLAQPLPFFSGAEGYGGSWSGAAPASGWLSNATVYHVTNLNDSGAGSLRGAFQENSSNKIIVFDVAGTINLTSDNLDIKNLSNYYIAGQTAPGPVTIYGDMAQLTHSSGKENRNVVLRYLSFRKGTGDNDDAITFAGSGLGTNMILDHVSASWSEDEILSVANNNTNVTVQYSTIHDALVSNHAYGSLIRPRIDSNVSFHHNLYAHNASRQARFGTYFNETLTADFRNNVVYNWRDRASYAGGSDEDENTTHEYADINFVGNYFIAGPGTGSNTTKTLIIDKNIDARVYQAGNFVDPDKSVNPGGESNGSDTGWGMVAMGTLVDQTLQQMATPFATAPVTTQSATDAYWQVINHVGNFWWQRGPIDDRVINNVLTNTGPPIGAAAPVAHELNDLLAAPLIGRSSDWDTDNDGMPDVWEVAHGLNPALATDNKLDFDNDGYINILEYLDETGAFPAPAPIVFHGDTNNRYAVITNWKVSDTVLTTGSYWQPSRFDEVQINSGTAVVDAVGQHARLLKIATFDGQSATLNITSGWLKAEDEIVIGANPLATADLNLSGGVLVTPTLSKGAGGTFNFTGGMLHADRIEFDLVNDGGTIAPGNSIGQTNVAGNVSLNSGALEIELASTSNADFLYVDSVLTLGGNLDVVTLGGFVPASGDNWTIITADGILGQFDSITAGYFVQNQDGGALRLFFGPPPGLDGDFNSDGSVDAADYVVWRKGLGTDYNQGHYELWRANFGKSTGGGSSLAGGSSVPEPSTAALLVVALAAAWAAGVFGFPPAGAGFRTFFARLIAWLDCSRNYHER